MNHSCENSTRAYFIINGNTWAVGQYAAMWRFRRSICFILGVVSIYIFSTRLFILFRRQQKTNGSKLLNALLITSSVAVTIRNLCNLDFYYNVTKELCILNEQIQVVSYAIGIQSVYMFIWTRQRLIYSNPALRLKSLVFNIIAWSIILVSFGACISCIFIFAVYTDLDVCYGRCEFTGDALFYYYRFYFLLTLFVVEHVLLLGLFLYPLFKQYFIKTKVNRTNKRIYAVIRRVLLVTAMCVFFDGTAGAISAQNQHNFSIMNASYSLSLTIALVSVVVSIKTWKCQLFPFLYKKNRSKKTITESHNLMRDGGSIAKPQRAFTTEIPNP